MQNNSENIEVNKVNVRAALIVPIFLAISAILLIEPFFLSMLLPYFISYAITIIYYYVAYKPADIYISKYPLKFAFAYNIISLIIAPFVFYIILKIVSTGSLGLEILTMVTSICTIISFIFSFAYAALANLIANKKKTIDHQ